MKPVLDIKNFRTIKLLGVDEKYKYENGERTDKTVYAYKLASQEQGEQITVKTPNKVELNYLQECELVEPDVKMYVQMSGDFELSHIAGMQKILK